MHESTPPPHTPPAFGLKISPVFILPFAHLDIIFPPILNAAPSWSITCFKLSLQPILPSRQKTLDIQDIKGKSRLKRSKCRMWTLLSPAPEILFSYQKQQQGAETVILIISLVVTNQNKKVQDSQNLITDGCVFCNIKIDVV